MPAAAAASQCSIQNILTVSFRLLLLRSISGAMSGARYALSDGPFSGGATIASASAALMFCFNWI